MKFPKDVLDKAALVLIDVQKGFDEPFWGTRNNPDAEGKMSLLLSKWRKEKLPIFHIKHNSKDPKSPLYPNQKGNHIKDIVKPKAGETLITKTVNSALIGTHLEATLRQLKIKTIVLIGLTTDHCVSTTARMAANLGFAVYVVSDATATFDRHSFDGSYHSSQAMHQSALASLHEEFATIVKTDELLGA